ncbi:MAG: YlxR family protein [Eubacteriales bacterium]|nr:YlxR family protein [Eubacteriales bacterium]MDY3332260.1 YlxR family protein [Gallibacter sp.]
MSRRRDSYPLRKCIGCGESKLQSELLRISVNSDNKLSLESKKTVGRGFYLCKCRDCFDKAVKKKAFNRVCKRLVAKEEINAIKEVVEQYVQKEQ